MYHWIIKQKLQGAFAQLNAGNYNSILQQFAPKFEHVFPGNHPLGGARHTPDTNRQWYERLYILFPDLHFEIKNIVVNGMPWNTLASVEWVDTFSGPDGQKYSNQGMHLFQLRWGKVTALHIYTDTQKLVSICNQFAKQGVNEAQAAPIVG